MKLINTHHEMRLFWLITILISQIESYTIGAATSKRITLEERPTNIDFFSRYNRSSRDGANNSVNLPSFLNNSMI